MKNIHGCLGRGAASVALVLLSLSGCNGDFEGGDAGIVEDEAALLGGGKPNLRPLGLGPITVRVTDGVTDDLLTAGLGKTGLLGAQPAFADPLQPTIDELRKVAIYQNYRGLIDPTTSGGFGTLYGPNVGPNGVQLPGDGKVAGKEFLAFMDNGSGQKNVSVMLQLPDTFDPENPCLVVGATPGSRGIYGSIGNTGELGLLRGCAVAYTDKGTGTGLHDLQANTVTVIDGARVSADEAGDASVFTADLSTEAREAFNAENPNRFAFKHAHSKQNPEKDWGRNTLDAVRFAFFVLNEEFGAPIQFAPVKRQVITPSNTIVIAASISNGGGAALAAAEQDLFGLIDGVVAEEPQVQVRATNLSILQGGAPVSSTGRTLIDYSTETNLYHLCAAAASASSPQGGLAGGALILAANRCAALHDLGLLEGDDLTTQANNALAKLHQIGWLPDSDVLQSTLVGSSQGLSISFTSAYGRFGIEENLCGFSFAGTNAATGDPSAPLATLLAQSFSLSGGQAPSLGVNFVFNDSVGGPKQTEFSVSPSTDLADRALDGDLCLRSLATGVNAVTGARLTGTALFNSLRLRAGVSQVLQSGNLRRKPTIILHGRSDTIIPVNHSGRAYFAQNQQREGAGSNTKYYELLNAQHLDALNAFPGFNNRFVPIQFYLRQSFDLMFDHLTTNAPLPPSQVVRTTPRGVVDGLVPVISAANVPSISASPAASEAITFSNNALRIPD